MIALGLVLLAFALLIGIFARLGHPAQHGRCPLCREPIDHRAWVCPHCRHDIDRVVMLKEMQRKGYVRAAIVIVVLGVLGYFSQVHSEPLRTQQDSVYYDAGGHRAGTASTDSQGTTTFRDGSGRTTGTATRDSQGTTTFRDSAGRTTGTRSHR